MKTPAKYGDQKYIFAIIFYPFFKQLFIEFIFKDILV
jgi:hypothetical protein